FNVQHDCVFCNCKQQAVAVWQQRIITDLTELEVKHSPQERYIVNMHALHNAHLLREVFPRFLTAPTP
ncbi:hypothetical protein B0H14DRAFT_2376855, partial [Mycena olivaceomarginata]